MAQEICTLRQQQRIAFPIRSISASGSENEANNERNVLDDNPETRWSMKGNGQFLIIEPIYDDQHTLINQLEIDFYKSNERQNFFKVQVSDDNQQYKDVTKEISSKKTSGVQVFDLPQKINSKFIKVIFNGNSDDRNGWNSVTQLKFNFDSEESERQDLDLQNVSRDGVQLEYPSSNILYGDRNHENFKFNFRDDGKRFDFKDLGRSFASAELIGYFRFNQDPVNDEVSGKQGGGRHSNGTRPKCYDVGIHIRTGKSRYRMEEEHPNMINGDTGGVGSPLGNKFIGYKFIKKNESNGVRLQLFQDIGNNEGDKPSNQWEKVSDWLETEFNWRTPPNEHMETIRIDDPGDNGLRNLEYKWICLSEIKSD
jgi:hypothetical protein